MDFNEDLKKTPSKKMTSSPRPFTRIFGTALAEIGQILRHAAPETTQIYAKTDLEALRALAPSWPGGAS